MCCTSRTAWRVADGQPMHAPIRYSYSGAGYTRADLTGQAPEFLLRLYRDMLRLRRIEERVESRYHEDQMKSPIHLVIGQEAISVGACTALAVQDAIYLSHRTHGNYLAKGGDLRAMLSELYCRANGCAGSVGGSMHLFDLAAGVEGSSAIVAGSVPHAVGHALAAQQRGTGQVIGVFFGDAAVEEGVFWESLNFAVLRQLPVLFFCENNFYSVCSPLSARQPGGVEIYRKAAAFGVNALLVDGTNVLRVHAAACAAAAAARSGQGPQFLELRAYRWRGHGGAGDDSRSGYRSLDEAAQWQQFCQLAGCADLLRQEHLLDPAMHDAMEAEIAAEIDAAFAHAINSPDPGPEELTRFVYSQ